MRAFSAAARRGIPDATPAERMPAALTKVRREMSTSVNVSEDRSQGASGFWGSSVGDVSEERVLIGALNGRSQRSYRSAKVIDYTYRCGRDSVSNGESLQSTVKRNRC
jgi:hypothetical protein